MLPQRLDILIAFKSISLAPDLAVTEKRVASAIVDHFNNKTTQCDPSLDTLAVLLGIHRRTVIRAVNRLVSLKYFRRVRHGGKYHRNFYEPIWSRFREVEAEWQRRRLAHSQRFCGKKVSPWQRQPEHRAGGDDVTQTTPTNISNETLPVRSIQNDLQGQSSSNALKRAAEKEQYSSIRHPNRQMFPVKQTSSREAAYDSAERRWNAELQKRYLATPDVYGEIIDKIDEAMKAAATEAEMQCRGNGVRYILKQLQDKNMRLLASGDDVAKNAGQEKTV
jgi:hypothetical protein